MPNLYRHWPVLAAALVATVHARPARACGATPCAQVSEVMPPEGSVGVPLNSEIRVKYFGDLVSWYEGPPCELDFRAIRLQPDGGEPIYLTGTVLPRPNETEAWVVAKHLQPLAANTSYAVQLLLGELEDPCRCEGRDWTTVASFTSGEAEDHEPPTFTGIDSVEYRRREQGDTSCGQSDGFPVYLNLAPVTDVAPRHNIYVDGQIATRFAGHLGSDQWPGLFVACAPSFADGLTQVLPGASVEIRAVDLAGNESPPNTPIIMDVTCEPLTITPLAPDAGASGSTTESTPSESAPSESTPSAPTDSSAPVIPAASKDSASGCDLSHRSKAASGAGAGIAAALLLLCGGRVASRRRASRA